MTKWYSVLLRDMFTDQTDTIILSAKALQDVTSDVYFDWASFETVDLENPYPVSFTPIAD